MTTLVEFVSRGYDDAKSAAQNLQGRATYEKQVDGLFLSDKVGPFVCECMKGGPYIFLVVGTTSSKAEERRDCLFDIRSSVNEVLCRVKKPVKHMLTARLAPILQEKIEKYNVTREVPTSDPGIARVKNELASVNALMVENIHKVLDRGEQLDDLDNNTGQLMTSSKMFQRQARKLKRKMWWQKWIWYILLLVCLGVLALFIYLMVKQRPGGNDDSGGGGGG